MGTHAPQGLTPAARNWWRLVTNTLEMSPHHQVILQMAAAAMSASERADEQIRKDGATVVDRFGQVQPHPAAVQSRQSKGLYCRLVATLEQAGLPGGAWGDGDDDDEQPPYDRLSWRNPVRDQT